MRDHWAKITERGGQNFLLYHKGGVKILFAFLDGGSKFLMKLFAPNQRPPYEVINERSLIHAKNKPWLSLTVHELMLTQRPQLDGIEGLKINQSCVE